MNFSAFVGNEKVKTELSYLLDSGRLPHAIILEGDEGVGKRTLAREIAANLLCRENKNNACFECPQCKKVMNSIHPDVIEFSASGSVNSFKVDDVRKIRSDVFLQPNEADYKVYILGNCQGMNVNAQNAILKVLEEPPAYAIFILTTTSKSAMLETVLSRCVVYNIKGVDSKKGADYICSSDDSVSYDDAFNAMTVCGGNIGKALLTLNDGKLSKISNLCNDICSALVKDNEYDLLITLSVFEKNNSMLVEVLSLLKTIFRDAMLYGSDTQILSGQLDSVKELSRILTKQKLIKMINVCDNITLLTNRNCNNTILITKLCYELRRAQNR